MARQLANRIALLERSRGIQRPHVLEVFPGETFDNAFARFVATWGAFDADHGFIIVPSRIAEHQRPAKEAEWAEQQRRLHSEVKTSPKDTMQ